MFNWLPFLTYAVITAGTPGPNTIMSMTNASRLGFKKALPFNFGILAGVSVVMTLCTLFCSLLSSIVTTIKLPMLIAGAAYMLYLAWKIFRSSSLPKEYHSRNGFVSGLLLQFVNAKFYIYCIVSMEAYILPYFSAEPVKVFFFATLLILIGFIFTVLWAAFGSVFYLLFSKYAKITNTIMALLLVYCAISLFL